MNPGLLTPQTLSYRIERLTRSHGQLNRRSRHQGGLHRPLHWTSHCNPTESLADTNRIPEIVANARAMPVSYAEKT
jgi:hypothetical protein